MTALQACQTLGDRRSDTQSCHSGIFGRHSRTVAWRRPPSRCRSSRLAHQSLCRPPGVDTLVERVRMLFLGWTGFCVFLLVFFLTWGQGVYNFSTGLFYPELEAP